MAKFFKFICVMSLFFLATGITHAATITIAPTDTQSVENCFPFGGGGSGWGPYTGYIYQNVPPFNVSPGDILAFDLGLQGNSDIQLDIAMAPAIGNGAVNEGAPFTTIVTNTQTPQNPRGDTTIGNFELRFTVEQPFNFSGGGLIIRFSNPSATYVLDTSCAQVLVNAEPSDASGYFVARFYNDNDGISPWDAGTAPNEIGGFRIITQESTAVPVPSMTQWGMIIFVIFAGVGAVYYLRRQKTA